VLAVVLAVVLAGLSAPLWAKDPDVYVVTSNGDSGDGTLRWAINQANASANPDGAEVRFAREPGGMDIVLDSRLPPLTNPNGVTIRGWVDPSSDLYWGITIHGCVLWNPEHGSGRRWCVEDILFVSNDQRDTNQPVIQARGAADVQVRGCRFESTVTRAGGAPGVYGDAFGRFQLAACEFVMEAMGQGAEPGPFVLMAPEMTFEANGNLYGIRIEMGSGVASAPKRATIEVLGDNGTFGGPNAGDGNFLVGPISVIVAGNNNQILGNRFGLKRNGRTVDGGDLPALEVYGKNNVIGGPGDSANYFAGHNIGVLIAGPNTTGSKVRRNFFGFRGDGLIPLDTPAKRGSVGVQLDDGTSANLIGGDTPDDRSFFACEDAGVLIEGAGASKGTRNNTIWGNSFGFNANGAPVRRPQAGVVIGATGPVGRQRIKGNYFCTAADEGQFGVQFVARASTPGGSGTDILENRFGVTPAGKAIATGTGIYTSGQDLRITDNIFGRAVRGVWTTGGPGHATLLGNEFRACTQAVYAQAGRAPFLGDWGTVDDGNNRFQAGCTWFIHNNLTKTILAEGNRFPTSSLADIEAKIWDDTDDPTRGAVDFDPLHGGDSPTGAVAAIVGLTASPTDAGAEIRLALVGPADVSVRVINIAGRPVRALCRDRALSEGRQTILWDGRADSGLSAPAGRYLVEVTARGPDGSQAQAMAPLTLAR
jgi:hypothetical protein